MLLYSENVPLHPFNFHQVIDVSLDVSESIYIKGKNGSGKTTILRTLAGNINCPKLKLDAQSSYYIGAKPLVLSGLTVLEQIHYYEILFGTKLSPSRDWLECDDMPVVSLSQGQKQRLSLLRLLYANAKVWLLDEPYNALDTQGVELLNELFSDHLAAGGGIIYSSHCQQYHRSRVLCL